MNDKEGFYEKYIPDEFKLTGIRLSENKLIYEDWCICPGIKTKGLEIEGVNKKVSFRSKKLGEEHRRIYDDIKRNVIDVINQKSKLEEQFSEVSIYQKAILEIIKGEFPNEKGEYTDFQVFCICRGHKMKASLYDKFINNTLTEKDKADAYQFVKTLKIDQVLFLMSLPEEVVRCEIFAKIFDILPKQENHQFQIEFGDISAEVGKNSILTFRYYDSDNAIYEDYIVAEKQDFILFMVNKKGFIKLENNMGLKNKNITSALMATYENLNNNYNIEIDSYGMIN